MGKTPKTKIVKRVTINKNITYVMPTPHQVTPSFRTTNQESNLTIKDVLVLLSTILGFATAALVFYNNFQKSNDGNLKPSISSSAVIK